MFDRWVKYRSEIFFPTGSFNNISCQQPIDHLSGSNSHPASDIHKIQREKSVTLREGTQEDGKGW